MTDFPPLAEDTLWQLIGYPYRLPDPGDENPSKDLLSERFLGAYRLCSLAGLTWGWLKMYHDLAFALRRFHPVIRDLFRSGQTAAFAQQVRAVADQAFALFSPSYEETLERWSGWREAAWEEGGWAEGEDDVFIGYSHQVVFALGNYHPKRTSCGTRAPYLKKDGRAFGFLNLNPNALPPSCPAGEYWPRLGAYVLPRWVGEMVTAADAPVHAREDRRFPQAHELKRTLEHANNLLNAAQADKRRVIPAGAIVQLPFGPFRSFEIHEVGYQVGFVARTHRGEFSLGYLQHTEDGWNLWWPCPLLIDASQPETGSVMNKPAIAAMTLLLAAVLHDFWTLEERTLEQVFADQNPKRVPGIRARRTGDGTTRIVYLPQVVYVDRPNVEACEQALELAKRARHPVRQHLRLSPTCSEKARLLAVQFGLVVPTGYTFVQAHWRGDGTPRPTLYRSRSALACLHALRPLSARKGRLRGLGFLEQVRNGLEHHGHQVLSVTNHFGPDDCGVDIRTLRQGIQWTIRVKEKPPDAKVQEPEVKAFADSLPSDRARTGGMLVTNTGYTKAAEDLASKLGIHTLLGERSAFPP